jgi:hypothetical protein
MTQMTWRKALLCGVLAAGLTVSLVPRASADPPPWAGRWHHNKHWNHDYDHDHGRGHWDRDGDYWKHRRYDWDRDRRWRYGRDYRDYRDYDDWGWRRRHYDRDYRYGHPYYGNYGYSGRNDPGYAKLMDRMRNDQAKIAEIEPTGRHRKALQWYKDDLNNAERDLDNYRSASR